MIDEIVDDLLKHANRLRTDANRTNHPLERADLLERAREFEQMASAADDRRGWSPPSNWHATEAVTDFSVSCQMGREDFSSTIEATDDPLLVAA